MVRSSAPAVAAGQCDSWTQQAHNQREAKRDVDPSHTCGHVVTPRQRMHDWYEINIAAVSERNTPITSTLKE